MTQTRGLCDALHGTHDRRQHRRGHAVHRSCQARDQGAAGDLIQSAFQMLNGTADTLNQPASQARDIAHYAQLRFVQSADGCAC